MTLSTPSQQLARFATELDLTRVPEEISRQVKLLLLDALGVGLAARGEPYSRIAMDVATSMGGAPESSVLGSAVKLPAPWTALVNGIQIHGHDFDDTHAGSVAHTTSVNVPVVLALAERQRLTGAQALTALIIGVEVTCRVGAAALGALHKRGFHTTAIAGAMGGSLAAGRCLGLTDNAMVCAQGIAGSSASGLREAYLSGGTWTKLYHPGWAAHAAVMAGIMAERGFTGTDTVYEGRFGLYRSHLHPEEWSPDVLLDGLEERWEILNVVFKPYPCGILNHPYIDLALQLMSEHNFTATDVDSVVAHIHPEAARTVCEPVESKTRPASGYHAKFSLQFNIAAALVDGEVNLRTYTDDKAKNPDIVDLAGRIEYAPDTSSPYPKTYPGRIDIHLVSGKTVSASMQYNRGSRENPMSVDEILHKFLTNAASVMDRNRAQSIAEMVVDVENIKEIQKVTDMLKGS